MERKRYTNSRDCFFHASPPHHGMNEIDRHESDSDYNDSQDESRVASVINHNVNATESIDAQNESSSRSKSAFDDDGSSGTSEQNHSAWRARRYDINFTSRELSSRKKAVRLRGLLRPKYRDLVVETERDIPDNQATTSWKPSMIGVSEWTAREKHVLFTSLSRIGRFHTRKLSELIGTKSECEVKQYLDLLHQGSVEDYLAAPRVADAAGSSLTLAAAEIDSECEARQELVAERTAWQADLAEKRVDQEKFGDNWLLDVDKAEIIERQIWEGDQETGEELLNIPSTKLLHLGNWLDLASIFMSRDAETSTTWEDYVEREDERPAIHQKTFNDFHEITLMLTKRLVQATIFQAMSRLKATRNNSPSQTIRHQDVQVACRMLEMKNDWHDYWTFLPRRLKLKTWSRSKIMPEVGDEGISVLQAASGRSLTYLIYDEVEQKLQARSNDDAFSPIVKSAEKRQIATEKEIQDPQNDSDVSITSYNSALWTDVSSPSASKDNTHKAQDMKMRHESDTRSESSISQHDMRTNAKSAASDFLRRETQYLEILDEERAKEEQERLLESLKAVRTRARTERNRSQSTDPGGKDRNLDFPVPEPIVPSKTPKRPIRKRQFQDILDWRDRVQYVPEWLSTSDQPKAEAFQAMEQRGAVAKKRRLKRSETGTATSTATSTALPSEERTSPTEQHSIPIALSDTMAPDESVVSGEDEQDD